MVSETAGTSNRPPTSTTWWALVILAVGAALRFAQIGSPLTHDELSAILRLQYDTLSDLIRFAVTEGDVHPAGVQVFMWIWAQCFGTQAWVMRIPFLLMGTASVWMIYRITSRWFGEYAALMAETIMATSQYTIYYSLVTRPYSPGLLAVLWGGVVLDIVGYRKAQVG